MNDIEVRKSPIEGKGVFALRYFQKGERVLEWGIRKELSEVELSQMSEDEKKRYVSFKEGKHLLSGEPMRYVNHSCDPNTNAQDNGDVAIRDIKAGEEVTSDYRDFGPEDIPCNCGASNCKGGM